MKWIGGVVVLILLVSICRVTVIPDVVPETMVNEQGETVVVEALSITDQYTLDHWDSKMIPTIKERAQDVETFLTDAIADLNGAGESYGNRANETSAWSFCLKGKAKVLGLENEDKPNKLLVLLDVAPYDGVADCKLFFGKVFSSGIKNAIRDGVGFLKLDDFANQVEFADLTTSFNNKVKNDILLQNDPTSFAGKEVEFYGCISLASASVDNFVIIPVELAVLGG